MNGYEFGSGGESLIGSKTLVPGVLRGFRAWKVRSDDMLWPIAADFHSWWPVGINTAQCSRISHFMDGDRISPLGSCSCGFYAAYRLSTSVRCGERAFMPLLDRRKFVFGSIAVWGRVILAEHGFRAQYARVEGLWGPESWKTARRLNLPWRQAAGSYLKKFPEPDVSDLLYRTD